jgi:hypothetical protein
MTPFDMAGCPHAHPDGMFSRRSETELVIEGGHTVDVDLWYPQKPGHHDHGIRGKIA